LANAHVGDKFNLEFDILGKYVQALLCKNAQGGEGAANFSELASPSAKKDENSSGGLTMELLRSAGF
jgi:hypothetical protein